MPLSLSLRPDTVSVSVSVCPPPPPPPSRSLSPKRRLRVTVGGGAEAACGGTALARQTARTGKPHVSTGHQVAAAQDHSLRQYRTSRSSSVGQYGRMSVPDIA
eukprot:580837-Rhodomonas_salina.1